MVPVESVDIFRGRPCNPFPYDFTFELLVKGPCLLAGRGDGLGAISWLCKTSSKCG